MDKEFLNKPKDLTPQKTFLNKIRYKENYNDLEKYYLLNKDFINLNEKDEDKNTPLIVSVTSKNYDAVRFISERITKDDINIQNSMGWNCLHSACCLTNVDDIIKCLIKSGADSNMVNKNKQTPLHLACGKNRADNIKLLLSLSNIELNTVDYNGFTPLIKAGASQAYDAILFLLDQPGVQLNKQDLLGNTALHYILEDNKYDVGIKMMQKGCYTDIKNSKGKTSIDLISDQNAKSVIQSYLSKIKEG